MLKVTPARALLLACVCALPLAGCAGNKVKSDTAYVARDVSSLYGAAQRTMQSGDYEQAAKLFDEVERQHPYSVWARHAQVMSAFNYYLANKYNDAISSAQRFLTIHPGSDEAPYAQYIIGMSYYQQIADVTRDQSVTQQATSAFNELIRRYPQSRYAADARLKLDLLNDHLAGKEMEDSGWRRVTGSAPWSTSIRPQATHPKPSSGWWRPISRSGFPTRRGRLPPCSAGIIRRPIGTGNRCGSFARSRSTPECGPPKVPSRAPSMPSLARRATLRRGPRPMPIRRATSPTGSDLTYARAKRLS